MGCQQEESGNLRAQPATCDLGSSVNDPPLAIISDWLTAEHQIVSKPRTEERHTRRPKSCLGADVVYVE